MNAQDLLNKLLEHQHSEAFEKPTDPNDDPESYQKLNEHMGTKKYNAHLVDLNTMKKKLEEFKYETKEEFVKDLQLIFDNGKIYYSKGSKNWKYAQELEKYSKKFLEKLKSPEPEELAEYKAILNGGDAAKPEEKKE